MSFQSELEAICAEVPGCRIAVVMSIDGISVATEGPGLGELDFEALLIELISPLKQSIQAMGLVEAGDLATYEVASQDLTVMVRLLSEEYYIALILSPEALLGQGRFAMRAHSAAFRAELI